jgi:hypothetical protein
MKKLVATLIATGMLVGMGTVLGQRSLGFSGGDYEFFVDGDEAPGSYLTVVTYTITAP